VALQEPEVQTAYKGGTEMVEYREKFEAAFRGFTDFSQRSQKLGVPIKRKAEKKKREATAMGIRNVVAENIEQKTH